MSRENMQQKRKKNRRGQHFLLTGIFLFLALSVGGILWFGLGGTAKKNSFREEFITIAQDGKQTEEEIKEAVAQTDYSAEQQEIEKDTGGAQDVGSSETWNLMLVNKNNPVPGNYDVNLVEVAGGEYVDERIYEPLMEMLEAAREGNMGELPLVVSGYRTQEKQQSLYDEKMAKFKKEGYSDSEAVELAKQWVAVPGYSEHQLGFAVDINGATYDVYLWLQQNSYKYGFIFRYPGSKIDITGVAEEVWHYRYVGREAAKEIYKRGICLEEYLDGRNLQ